MALTIEQRLTALEQRVTALEKKHHNCPDGVEVDEQMRRARRAVEDAKLYSAVWKWVPSSYYGWNLGQRAKYLTSSEENVEYLCKSLLMENKKIASKDPDPSTNPRYVMVIVQYAATLSNKKLTSTIRSMRPVQERIDWSRFDFRVASSEDNDRLTGYKHNSVTPFGLLAKDDIALVLSKEVASKPFFWMGGGHVDLKIRVATSEFIEKVQPIVGDISDPRDDFANLVADD